MQFFEIVKAIIFGIIEGITEWLPISSTGHMILAEEFLKLNVSPEFWNMFLVVVQLGAILAVVWIFWKKIFPFSFSKGPFIKKDVMNMWMKVLVALIPTIIIGLPLNETLERLFNKPVPVAMMLILYGVLFILVENRNRGRKFKVKDISQLTYAMALVIGLFQVLSIFPGTSRSGATIIGAMLIGTSRYVAAEFTFFLAIPTMFGASLLKLIKFGFTFTSTELAILIAGMISAFIVSVMAIKFLMNYIKKHDFKVFGYYRIILGVIVLLYFLLIK